MRAISVSHTIGNNLVLKLFVKLWTDQFIFLHGIQGNNFPSWTVCGNSSGKFVLEWQDDR
jgi:hypothetical protein